MNVNPTAEPPPFQSGNPSAPLYNDQKFKLGLFGMNTSGGTTMSSADIARRTDALGLEMMLSAIRWNSIAGTSEIKRARTSWCFRG
jgi:hypothetical protein